MRDVERKKHPKILVISNNSFSKTSNNGKTLSSFFKHFQPENIAQLYFSHNSPDEDHYSRYFRISDVQVLKSCLTRRVAGEPVEPVKYESNDIQEVSTFGKAMSYMAKLNLFRLLREIMWYFGKWQSKEFEDWVLQLSPDLVFFCAGDSIFAYRIVKYVLSITNSNLIIYVTDDYVLHRKYASPSWQLRRKLVYKHMHRAIKKCNLFITISQEMRLKYKELFGKDSHVMLNIVDNGKSAPNRVNNIEKGKVTNLIYAGGLHLKRYKTLNMLAKELEKFNKTAPKKAFLSIYSTSIPSQRILKLLSISETCAFLGGLSSEELRMKLMQSDIPVHVESFDRKAIKSSILSISTKIPEYLSLNKPILAVGPQEVASMKYLKGVACCVTRKIDLNTAINRILNDKNLRKVLSEAAHERFLENHEPQKVIQAFHAELEKVMDTCGESGCLDVSAN